MSPNFDVNRYWLNRGQTYRQEQRLQQDYFRLQEQFLLDVLAASGLGFSKVLELGCGYGRITKLLAERFPTAQITALDLSPDQLTQARRYCAGAANVVFHPYDFYTGAPFPGDDFDAAIAIEVFLHHPREVVLDLFQRLAAVARHLVNLDWSESWPWPTEQHVWIHDYPALYAASGLACATFVLPQKIDGKQQKLFLAAKTLSPQITGLERQLREAAIAAGSTAADSVPPADVSWSHQLGQAVAELTRLVPRSSTFILVDDAQWGHLKELADYRVFPFLERDGQYWGSPADDTVAWSELERLRQAGAAFLVFAWPCFWWLAHYAGFHRQLRSRFACVLENERLVIFQLNS